MMIKRRWRSLIMFRTLHTERDSLIPELGVSVLGLPFRNTVPRSAPVKTLQTSMDIIEQHAAIKALLDLYESLVVKDAKDMDALVKEAEKMDQSIASTHRV